MSDIKDGVVVDSCHGIYSVKFADGTSGKYKLAGRMMHFKIMVIVNDRVKVRVDGNNGQIVSREKPVKR